MQEKAAGLSALGKDVYFGLGITAEAKREGRASNAEVIGIPGVWLDLDLKHDTHKQQDLPATLDEIKGKLPVEPSIVVHSGHGVHLYWLFREVLIFDTAEDKKRAEGLLQGFQAYIKQRLGYKLDSTFDLARVLRLPGTMNYKAEPVPVQIIAENDLRYNFDDLDQYAIDTPVKADPVKREGFKRLSTDGSAGFILTNCKFLQHWQLNYKTLPEPIWMAACTNLIRGVGGEEIVAGAVKEWLGDKYKENETYKKIQHWFSGAYPTTCQYIQETLGFEGCDQCGVKSPCCWSVEAVPRSLAHLRTITTPTPDNVYAPETLGALAILKSNKKQAEYENFCKKCQGYVNLNDLKKAVKEQRAKDLKLHVVEGGAALRPIGEKSTSTHASVPDTPLFLVIPEGFTYGPGGVNECRIDENGQLIVHSASWNPVIISGHIENVDIPGSEKIELSFKNRGKWKKTICKRSDVFVSRNLPLLSDCGLGVSSETSRYLVKYLQALEVENMERIPRKKAVSKLGWRDKETVFVLPGIESGYEVDLSSGSESKISGFGQVGDFNAWIAKMQEVRKRDKARLIMAASFAAPLLQIVNQRPFAIHNWDNTRGGKTATQHAALSIWGKPGEIARTFDDTRTSLERTAALYTDLPLGINEYELLNNKKKENIDSMIYQICEGQGRGRGTVTGLQDTAKWRTVAITNGESQIIQDSTKGGVFTRLVEIKGGPLFDDDMFASSLYAFTARNYGHAGKAFIEKLLTFNHDEIRERYKQGREIFRQDYPDNIPSHLDIMACLAVAEYYASVWIFDISPQVAAMDAVRITKGAIADLATQSDADESLRAWDWLPDWIAMNSKKFNSLFSTSYETPGYVDEEYIYIVSTELKKALKQAGFNANKVLGAWAEQDKIPFTKLKEGGRRFGIRSTKEFIDTGVRPTVIPIKKVRPFEEFIEELKNPSRLTHF